MSKTIKRTIVLSGTTPLMFDRYPGNNKEQLSIMDKIYKDGDNLVFPSLNLMSFLSSQNTESAPQRVIGRGWKEVAKSALSYIQINPFNILITRNGEPIKATEENIKVHRSVARIKKGVLSVPNPKERPYIETPWQLEFNLTLLETPALNESLLQKIFEIGGTAIGIGTFRGVFGKFEVIKWE